MMKNRMEKSMNKDMEARVMQECFGLKACLVESWLTP